jgi:UDP-N-acetylmuramate dehydrogenase
LVLGGGSNLVVADRGFPGVVIKMAITGIQPAGAAAFEVGAGEDWDGFVAHCVERDLAGVECLSGIPGTVGGTPIQNVGAYGQEVAETITAVRALDLTTGRIGELSPAACGFRYRQSVFNTSARGRYIVLRVSYRLHPGGAPPIEYADLKRHFAGRAASLSEAREAVRAIRRSKAMLLVPGDDDCRSAGSFFKNPIVDGAPEGAPSWPAAGGKVKVAAAWLVEQSGFPKGWSRGPVGISRKHALAIVNRGGATAAEIVAVMTEIQQCVQDKFGIWLEPEPVFVGGSLVA